MTAVTYHVVLAFMRSEDGDIVATEPKEARGADQVVWTRSASRKREVARNSTDGTNGFFNFGDGARQ